jgi:hypothetical protein
MNSAGWTNGRTAKDQVLTFVTPIEPLFARDVLGSVLVDEDARLDKPTIPTFGKSKLDSIDAIHRVVANHLDTRLLWFVERNKPCLHDFVVIATDNGTAIRYPSKLIKLGRI